MSNVFKIVDRYADAQRLGQEVTFCIPMQRPQLVPPLGIAMVTSDTPPQATLCSVQEDRYKVKDHYKITLAAHDPSMGKETFYISDLDFYMHHSPDRFFMQIDGQTVRC